MRDWLALLAIWLSYESVDATDMSSVHLILKLTCYRHQKKRQSEYDLQMFSEILLFAFL